jgi:hypothetical protein
VVDINGFTSTEGIGMRVFDTFDQGGASNGYFIWFPQYHSVGAGGANPLVGSNTINSFVLNTPNAAAGPTNTAAQPFGSTAGSSYQDPAYGWVNGSAVADARTHVACIQARYVGAVSTSQGLIATLTNIPMDLFQGGSFPSVDQLFQQSRDIRRLDFDVHEVRHRPSDANIFQDAIDGPFTLNAGTQATQETAQAAANGPRAIGFAWKAVVANSITFNRYKVIEWRPMRGAGIPAVPIRSSGTAIFPEAMRHLDEAAEKMGVDWTTAAQKIASAVTKVFAPGADVPFRAASAVGTLALSRAMSQLTM